MLADAFEHREGIAVLEGARRNAWTMIAVTAVPFLGFRAAFGRGRFGGTASSGAA